MTIVNILPLIAAILIILSFVPLFKKIIKNKSTVGLSTFMIILGLLQCILFSVHDVYFHRYTMAFTFAILGILFLFIFILIIKYRKDKLNG